MREIKFRSFDLDRKIMDFFDLDTYDEETNDVYGTIQQYTGLKDKNGKEIYEGDVIKYNFYGEEYITLNVIFSAGCFEVDGAWYSNCLSELVSSEIEIIGNIYENTELLK